MEQSGTILTMTFPLRLRSPKSGVFPAAPRPRFPRTRFAPKYDSSTSNSPLSLRVSASTWSMILWRKSLYQLFTVLRFTPTISAQAVAVMSVQKHRKSLLNFWALNLLYFTDLHHLSSRDDSQEPNKLLFSEYNPKVAWTGTADYYTGILIVLLLDIKKFIIRKGHQWTAQCNIFFSSDFYIIYKPFWKKYRFAIVYCNKICIHKIMQIFFFRSLIERTKHFIAIG